jgi:hypothetical protein
LQFDPNKRPTITQILEHPYFAEHHKPEKEIVCTKRLQADARFREIIQVRKKIYELANEMNEEVRKERKKLVYYEKYNDYLND